MPGSLHGVLVFSGCTLKFGPHMLFYQMKVLEMSLFLSSDKLHVDRSNPGPWGQKKEETGGREQGPIAGTGQDVIFLAQEAVGEIQPEINGGKRKLPVLSGPGVPLNEPDCYILWADGPSRPTSVLLQNTDTFLC